MPAVIGLAHVGFCKDIGQIAHGLLHIHSTCVAELCAATTSSSNYQSIFDNAIEAYKKKTKRDLRSHPLLDKLQSCHSPDAVLNILYEQIPGFDQSSGTDDKLTKWLNPTVNVLASPKGLRVKIVPDLIFDWRTGIPTSCSGLHWNWHPSLGEYFFVHSIYSRAYRDAKLSQAGKAVSDSQGVLTTVFECMKTFSDDCRPISNYHRPWG